MLLRKSEMPYKSLSKQEASKFALLALTARQKRVPFEAALTVGKAEDEVFFIRPEKNTLIVFIDGSDLDNISEWRNNIEKYVGGTFGGAVPEICQLLESKVREGDFCVIVGYSRGASIAIAVGETSEREHYVVTVGDPGLATSEEKNVTSLFNQFDVVYGLVSRPTGEAHCVSSARWKREGWRISIEDVGIHTNYGTTLVDEASGAADGYKDPDE